MRNTIPKVDINKTAAPPIIATAIRDHDAEIDVFVILCLAISRRVARNHTANNPFFRRATHLRAPRKMYVANDDLPGELPH